MICLFWPISYCTTVRERESCTQANAQPRLMPARIDHVAAVDREPHDRGKKE